MIACTGHHVEALEQRTLFTGVTLVTHGFGGSASDWVTTMGNLVAQQSGTLADQPRYLMTVTDPGHDNGPLTVTSTRIGPAYAGWGSREIVVLLDWSDVAGSFPFGGYNRPTAVVGAAVADKLLGAFSIPDLAAPLAELPIHMLGHSRGAGVISEAARSLGERGAWVDHLTYLDPHPVDGVRDPLGLNFGDAPMRVYENVQYADDFWRTQGDTSFDFTGEAVAGAANLQLSESILTSGGYSVEHSDTHLWYHGTIGTTSFSDSDGAATIGSGWYSAPQGPRDSLAWRASRIAATAGARLAAGLKSAGAARNAVTLSASGANLWDNVQIVGLLADQTLVSGTSLPVSVEFEDKSTAGGARDAMLTIGFDRDDNPYNGFASSILVATSTLGSDSYAANLAMAGFSGAFRVFAKIGNGTHARYYYAPGKAIVTGTGATKTWIGSETGNWSVASNWTSAGVPAASDKVAIYDSDVTLDAAGTTATIAGLNLAGEASLSLGSKNLVVDYTGSSPIADLRAMLIDGRTSTGSGIFSDAANSSGGFRALGYGEASEVLNLSSGQTATFAGVSVDATSILIRYTHTGDANLSGVLDSDDYFRTDAGFASQTIGFATGDFDFNNRIDTDDYFLLDANYARHAPALNLVVTPISAPAPLASSRPRDTLEILEIPR